VARVYSPIDAEATAVDDNTSTQRRKPDARRSRPVLGLFLAGLGLLVAGTALWFLAGEAQVRDQPLPVDLAAIPVEVDLQAPALSLTDLSGRQRALVDYRGNVVLVNLWATWCPPCAAEMPVFQRFFEKHRESGFVVLGINDGESGPVVREFAARQGLTFPIWLDPTYEATERAFRAPNLPTSYVIDRMGRIRLTWIGGINEANLENHVTPLIAE